MQNLQSLQVNRWLAAIASQYLTTLVEQGQLTTFQTTVDLRAGAMHSLRMTLDNVRRAGGPGMTAAVLQGRRRYRQPPAARIYEQAGKTSAAYRRRSTAPRRARLTPWQPPPSTEGKTIMTTAQRPSVRPPSAPSLPTSTPVPPRLPEGRSHCSGGPCRGAPSLPAAGLHHRPAEDLEARAGLFHLRRGLSLHAAGLELSEAAAIAEQYPGGL